MTIHDINLVWIAVALVFSLSAGCWWRAMGWRTERPWDGHGINASALRRQIAVRRDSLTMAHQHGHHSGQHRFRLELTRRGLERLPYFNRQSAQKGNCPASSHESDERSDS